MIDTGKLLGGLLGNSGILGDLGGLGGLGSSGRGGLPGKAAIGVSLLGVAMAAFEHFSEQRSASSPASGGAAPSGFPPPPPGAASGTPPPPPGGMGLSGPPAAPPAPPASATREAQAQADPVLLIRAMIAAANADGRLDETERMRILGQLEGVGLSEEEKDFLCAEFDAPWTRERIAAGAASAAEAAQVFTVSLLAVDVDTEAERMYMDGLRTALGLSEEQALNIARRLGRDLS